MIKTASCFLALCAVKLLLRLLQLLNSKKVAADRTFSFSRVFIIDDCSAEGEINKKRDALSELAFSGRHRNHSLWILTQKYNSVLKDVREQIKWLCLFFTKDRDSFEDCLRENDVIPDKSERDRLKKCLQDRPYSKLILKCYQPTGYYLL